MPSSKTPQIFSSTEELSLLIEKQYPAGLRLAAPLGMGKPNRLLNSIYAKARNNPQFQLELYTALSLGVPHPKSLIEQRFLGPFAERHFGKDYPELQYDLDRRNNKLPSHVRIYEFYMQSGSYNHCPQAQKDYISINYTHAAGVLGTKKIDVVVQMVAKRVIKGEVFYSLSSNPDMTLDLKDLYNRKDRSPIKVIGVVHPGLPFLGGDAQVTPDFFEMILEDPSENHQLFALPKEPISDQEYMIALHASQFVKDGGTLQIGIGSLGIALIHFVLMRTQRNDVYKNLISTFKAPACEEIWDLSPLKIGLYGMSELLSDGFMHLRKAGLLNRTVRETETGIPRYMHGAFYLGSKELYAWLGQLQGEDYDGLGMTSVLKINDLYDENEFALRKQRKEARFFNICMEMNLLGAASSDTLSDGKVVSGVGGQYNFVAMASELPDAKSILMLKSARTSAQGRTSNIKWIPGQNTVPRHLRDIVVTEYGIASLKGKTDEQVICALIEISEAAFQDELMTTAKKNGKLSADYRIPERARQNTPENIAKFVESHRQHLPYFAFGSDFTPVEEGLVLALLELKEASSSWQKALRLLLEGFKVQESNYTAEIKRMGFDKVGSVSEWLYKKLLLGALSKKSARL